MIKKEVYIWIIGRRRFSLWRSNSHTFTWTIEYKDPHDSPEEFDSEEGALHSILSYLAEEDGEP